MLGGLDLRRARRFWGVSPVRVSTVMASFISSMGASRLRATSVARALRGET